jgi:hypothetical protein
MKNDFLIRDCRIESHYWLAWDVPNVKKPPSKPSTKVVSVLIADGNQHRPPGSLARRDDSCLRARHPFFHIIAAGPHPDPLGVQCISRCSVDRFESDAERLGR